ncbi:MAG: hypothetical protein WAU45_15805 [Blastocatellia bacterium]
MTRFGAALSRGSSGVTSRVWNRFSTNTHLLTPANVPLSIVYGGTVLGCAVWSAVNETRLDHVAIIEALLAAGADIDKAAYPTGNKRVDEVLRRHGAKSE